MQSAEPIDYELVEISFTMVKKQIGTEMNAQTKPPLPIRLLQFSEVMLAA